MDYILELCNITKKFGNLVANDKVTIRIKRGQVHSIVGENGAGKSTMMNVAFGLLQHDDGEIIINGEKTEFKSPLDAIEKGIGMIHQHFMLIPTMTVLDNIILGYETGRIKLNRKKSREELKPLFKGMGLSEDIMNARISELSVGIQQKIEIIKALYRQAKVIIFDEPTAVLTPQEIKEFFVLVKDLVSRGKTIIFISHKLDEIMEISDEISVMRSGRLIGCVRKDEVNQDILTKMMIGRDLGEQKVVYKDNHNDNVIEVKELTTIPKRGGMALKNLSFSVKKGEIFGIAGVTGNGQTELVEVLVALQKSNSGSIMINGIDVTGIPAHKRTDKLSYIPEDRQKEGLIMPFTVAENLILGKVDLPEFVKNKFFINFSSVQRNAEVAVSDYSIKISENIHDKVKSLSGGNQQKVIVARELSRDTDVILAVNPTRGIDIGAIEYIHSCLIKERDKGRTILLISNELSEIMALSDRIGVIHDGKIVKIFNNHELLREEVGYYMLGGKEDNYSKGGEERNEN